jgi:hypothetical protein
MLLGDYGEESGAVRTSDSWLVKIRNLKMEIGKGRRAA